MTKHFTIALLVCVALMFGCGRSDSKTYKSKDGKVTVNQKGDKQTYEVTTKDGNFKMATGESGVALPDDFPKDVPVYPGATVKASYAAGKVLMVHLQTKDSIADSGKFYQEQLKNNGWEIGTTLNQADTSMVTAKKAGRQCNAVCAKEGAGTLIQLQVMAEGS
jgi:hypothetical protein